MLRTPLLVLSHLRWNFVFQRPQHVMTRLGRSRPVWFVEEPTFEPGAARVEVLDAAPGVRVVRTHTPTEAPGFGERQNEALAPLLSELLACEGCLPFGAWLYTPMATSLARRLGPRAVVYDCMDELSAFLGAPPELIDQERELLSWADAVFTGGPSLWRAKRDRHPRVHCFPSSVDVPHFASAVDAEDPADQAKLPHPRLGYFGVVDERLDLGLLDALATSHPEWSVIVVGPVVKIDPATLPRRANLHYLGSKDYLDLPAYVGGWDACLMPFALNEATRHISPTKSLEYMAAGKPVVSTPITDVAEPYGEIVHLGRGRDAFVAACERALFENGAAREARLARAAAVLDCTSWDRTVRNMDTILESLLEDDAWDEGVRRRGAERAGRASSVHLPAPTVSSARAASAAAGPREALS